MAARFVGNVREEILLAFLEEMSERGLTKSDIANLLGVHRSVISRVLNGKAPLELRTIGQLAWALGRDPEFKLPKKKRRSRPSNHPPVVNSTVFPSGFSTVETP
ncbi:MULTISPECIES: transcriptional regulator [unclassified Bradyrhizobium]|uniref:helix-turn-helix transcriptional regulator n=1 Tax=unclassified Bradyrhizobium TaxID=2631580 RepID=UPI0029164FD4|nr:MULTISPECIES: helix-turn-helix domain-containing protein [unclassified Bradyrhizobium]